MTSSRTDRLRGERVTCAWRRHCLRLRVELPLLYILKIDSERHLASLGSGLHISQWLLRCKDRYLLAYLRWTEWISLQFIFSASHRMLLIYQITSRDCGVSLVLSGFIVLSWHLVLNWIHLFFTLIQFIVAFNHFRVNLLSSYISLN